MRDIMADNPAEPSAETSLAAAASPIEVAIESPSIMDKARERRKPVFNPTGRIEDIDDDEIKIADIRRHPVGLIIIYIQFIFAIALSIGVLALLLPSFMGSSKGAGLLVGALTVVMTGLGVFFLILATGIYRRNQLIVTDLHVTEVQQMGLFNRKVSELSMANIEDVTSTTHGFFSTMFNYGTLRVETANEQHNFVFKYCPNSNAYAKAIQDCRSAYLQKYGSGHTH